MALLTLDPANAVLSVQKRIALIAEAKKYVREVVTRYDGLKSFDDPLKAAGVWSEIQAILAEGTP